MSYHLFSFTGGFGDGFFEGVDGFLGCGDFVSSFAITTAARFSKWHFIYPFPIPFL
jgi:hypothetical protein